MSRTEDGPSDGMQERERKKNRERQKSCVRHPRFLQLHHEPNRKLQTTNRTKKARSYRPVTSSTISTVH